jgi:single-strand DNA-binding protein
MLDTHITVVGNLVADPRFVTLPNGQSMATFRLASTPRRFDRGSGEWRDGETLYASVTCWRALAENVATSLKKGQAAIVTGRLSTRQYETKEGEKRVSVDIDATAVGPELSRVVTLIKRAERGVAIEPAVGADGAHERAAAAAFVPAADSTADRVAEPRDEAPGDLDELDAFDGVDRPPALAEPERTTDTEADRDGGDADGELVGASATGATPGAAGASDVRGLRARFGMG